MQCRAHSFLGSTLLKQEKLDEGVAAFREATRLEPDNPFHHFSLGFALERQEKFDLAIDAYREAIRVDPSYFLAHASLG